MQYLIVCQLKGHLNEGIRADLTLLHVSLPKCVMRQTNEIDIIDLLLGEGKGRLNTRHSLQQVWSEEQTVNAVFLLAKQTNKKTNKQTTNKQTISDFHCTITHRWGYIPLQTLGSWWGEPYITVTMAVRTILYEVF